MKSGTSSLRDYLRGHPEVYIPPDEELHYFAEAINWKQGLDWYRARFADAGDAIAVGEKSPTYTMHPEHPGVPGAHRTTCSPTSGMIYVVRHPIQRIKSHYVHQFGRGHEARPDPAGRARGPPLPRHHPLRDAAAALPRLVPGRADPGGHLRAARSRADRHVRPHRRVRAASTPTAEVPALASRSHESSEKQVPSGFTARLRTIPAIRKAAEKLPAPVRDRLGAATRRTLDPSELAARPGDRGVDHRPAAPRPRGPAALARRRLRRLGTGADADQVGRCQPGSWCAPRGRRPSPPPGPPRPR